jgi:hypothetical protein
MIYTCEIATDFEGMTVRGKEVIPCEYDAVGLPVEGISRIIKKSGNVSYLGYWNLELGMEIVTPNKQIF